MKIWRYERNRAFDLVTVQEGDTIYYLTETKDFPVFDGEIEDFMKTVIDFDYLEFEKMTLEEYSWYDNIILFEKEKYSEVKTRKRLWLVDYTCENEDFLTAVYGDNEVIVKRNFRGKIIKTYGLDFVKKHKINSLREIYSCEV